ncbi:MAG TPA: archaemetzincin [Puia sp.]|jgi:archaemetzincin|nr:archaemetzincin [Puia sp.]
MRRILLPITTFLFLLTGPSCRRHSLNTVHTIAIQPIGAFPRPLSSYLQGQLDRFFHKPVVILPATEMPAAFLDSTKGPRYSADSLVRFLSRRTNDSISIILGLTSEDIYTTVRDNTGPIKDPPSKYAVWGIFGLGSCPGEGAIVSIHRLQSADNQSFLHRFRTVALHELGHNLGLPHCPNAHCIMNDANEKISTVDNSGDDFCPSCWKKL